MAGILDDIGKFLKDHMWETIAATAVVGTIAGIAIAKGQQKTYVIPAGDKKEAVKSFDELFGGIGNSEEIVLCDPFIASSTLQLFSVFKGKIRSKTVRILTSNVTENKVLFVANKFRLEIALGLRFVIKSTKEIHDRYMILGNRCFVIGSSIKDLGNKDTTIQESAEPNKLIDLFNKRWSSGQDFK